MRAYTNRYTIDNYLAYIMFYLVRIFLKLYSQILQGLKIELEIILALMQWFYILLLI